jgi:hypothetical protein
VIASSTRSRHGSTATTGASPSIWQALAELIVTVNVTPASSRNWPMWSTGATASSMIAESGRRG